MNAALVQETPAMYVRNESVEGFGLMHIGLDYGTGEMTFKRADGRHTMDDTSFIAESLEMIIAKIRIRVTSKDKVVITQLNKGSYESHLVTLKKATDAFRVVAARAEAVRLLGAKICTAKIDFGEDGINFVDGRYVDYRTPPASMISAIQEDLKMVLAELHDDRCQLPMAVKLEFGRTIEFFRRGTLHITCEFSDNVKVWMTYRVSRGWFGFINSKSLPFKRISWSKGLETMR